MSQVLCQPNLTYDLEILQSPVGLTAINKSGYTELNFYAQNVEADFDGYKITTGATAAEAAASTTYYNCENFTTPISVALNKPLKAYLGKSGGDCSNSSIGILSAGRWVSIRSHGSRDCTKYKLTSDCAYSNPASAMVVAEVPAPTNPAIQAVSTYYVITLTLPATTTGLGIFYSPDPDDANNKAMGDINLYDGFCATGASFAGASYTIQIGGTVGAYNCYIGNFFLQVADTIAIRNADSANTVFPWSDPLTVSVP
ncbi:MAG: hypothetical protein OEV66_07225 [Spirochaetia bacterium]|nr:hypothetical protein [Spirochaetia bacterium]